MSSSSTTNALLLRNKQIAATHTPSPYLSEIESFNVSVPKVLIVSCLDPRVVPERFLGLGPLDAGVIRNVCGHVRPALNDILALDHVLGLTEIMVIHHTDCGALHFTNSAVREAIKARVPGDSSSEQVDFGAITDLEQSVKDDLDILKGSILIRKELADQSSGYVFDIKTGLLSAVDP